jgi:hypothetical protein
MKINSSSTVTTLSALTCLSRLQLLLISVDTDLMSRGGAQKDGNGVINLGEFNRFASWKHKRTKTSVNASKVASWMSQFLLNSE